MQTIGSTSGLRNNAKLFGHTSVVTDIHGRALPLSKRNVAFGSLAAPQDSTTPTAAFRRNADFGRRAIEPVKPGTRPVFRFLGSGSVIYAVPTLPTRILLR